MVNIDYQQLSPDTLEHLLREIVLREGTDYGECEIPTEIRVEQLKQNLLFGKATIIYNVAHNFCDVVSAKEIKKAELNFKTATK